MIFLQPLLLAALPLLALPIIIHLINQRRYQTLPWGAMMFLLAANRMSRGYARLRQWLILLFRAVVIAALIFAISRPLASGWVGSAVGGVADTTIVLLDRSPSMQQRSGGSNLSKLETGTAQLARSLAALGTPRYVLIESATNAARELESIDSLPTLSQAGPTEAAADVPAMLLTALDYIRANKVGRTDLWICSDLRENDWNPNDARWQSLREAFAALGPRVRFHLLAYPAQPGDGRAAKHSPTNHSIRVTGVRRQSAQSGAELRVSLQVMRTAAAESQQPLPIEFEIEGARSVLSVEWEGPVFELEEHSIPLPANLTRGHGRVSIPADANPADNDFYFVFDAPPPRHTVIVSDDPAAAEPLELAARIAPAADVTSTAERIDRTRLATIAWERVALLLWHGPLPRAEQAELVESFVASGGQVIFFPPLVAGPETAFGVRWQDWHESPEPLSVRSWRGDGDLLRNTLSGQSLSVGQLEIRGYSSLEGEATELATLENSAPLLVRAATPRGGAYFWTTTPHEKHSTLARDGVVLYVTLQRAAAAGAEALSSVAERTAGPLATPTGPDATLPPAEAWAQLAGPADALSSEYPVRAGVYAHDDRLWAVNRASSEDRGGVLSDERLATLFGGLPLQRVDDRAGNLQSLVQEVWRVFLMGMMAAMVIEAALCLPSRSQSGGSAA
ncbi:BatA domain-containing protein [Candidatus Laterigemmans baculatus]|uniref:BatA domain-containing protein n=1 Tax=Candidatus Laterigemmans baculatus TaxID=2770505 RepID=UPI0013D960CC|nr:BatA domain-containing protein [Candidatus Laterigemmans baculatus]